MSLSEIGKTAKMQYEAMKMKYETVRKLADQELIKRLYASDTIQSFKGDEGVTIFTVTEDDKKYLIKVTPEQVGYDQGMNEAFIGMVGIPQLQSENFLKFVTANSTWCESPNKNTPLSFEDYEGDTCSYVVMEFIEGQTLTQYLKTASVTDLRKIYLTILRALYQAHITIDFTHYDLHTSNVIVKPDGTPVIIDYGASHMKYEGKDLGLENPKIWVYNKGMWFHDVFKILMMTYLLLNPKIMNIPGIQDSIEFLKEAWKEDSDELERPNNKPYRIESVTRNIQDLERAIEKQEEELREASKVHDFMPYLSKLISFFEPEKTIDAAYVINYRTKVNEYFSPSNMINQNYDFSKFMELAEQVL